MMLRTVSLVHLRTCDVTFSLGCLTNHLSAQRPEPLIWTFTWLVTWWPLTLVVLSVQLLGVVSAEVPEDDPADLHALPGVPHPAERGSGS